jgi:hypothetical protein
MLTLLFMAFCSLHMTLFFFYDKKTEWFSIIKNEMLSLLVMAFCTVHMTLFLCLNNI